MRYGMVTLRNSSARMISKNEWMTNFYGKDWYTTNIDDYEQHKAGLKNCMVECRVDAAENLQMLKAQAEGFTLTESLIKFTTQITERMPSPDYVRPAEKRDEEAIMEMIKQSYFQHEKFYNRFKNRQFFTEEQGREYYMAGFINYFKDPRSITIVAEDEEGVYAFRMLKYVGPLEYEGVTMGILERGRGRKSLPKLQNKVWDVIGEPYTEHNATQLGNYYVINNHMKQGRVLSKVEHIYLKLVP